MHGWQIKLISGLHLPYPNGQEMSIICDALCKPASFTLLLLWMMCCLVHGSAAPACTSVVIPSRCVRCEKSRRDCRRRCCWASVLKKMMKMTRSCRNFLPSPWYLRNSLDSAPNCVTWPFFQMKIGSWFPLYWLCGTLLERRSLTFFDRRTFPVPRSTCKWWVTTYIVVVVVERTD